MYYLYISFASPEISASRGNRVHLDNSARIDKLFRYFHNNLANIIKFYPNGDRIIGEGIKIFDDIINKYACCSHVLNFPSIKIFPLNGRWYSRIDIRESLEFWQTFGFVIAEDKVYLFGVTELFTILWWATKSDCLFYEIILLWIILVVNYSFEFNHTLLNKTFQVRILIFLFQNDLILFTSF